MVSEGEVDDVLTVGSRGSGPLAHTPIAAGMVSAIVRNQPIAFAVAGSDMAFMSGGAELSVVA